MTQVLKAVNATKKVATKKVAKVLTQEQKDAIAKKRALNPQFANLQSAKRKVENLEYKKDLKKILIEVKRTTTLNNVDTKSIEKSM